jgi:hypothetical protein
MKTIEQAAVEYANIMTLSVNVRPAIICTFKDAIRFAQQWISVDDELPEERLLVLISSDGFFKDVACIEDKRWIYRKSGEYVSINVTHWRPIELK